MFDKNKILRILENYDFKCQQCSVCCRHEPGAVFLTKEDVIKIHTKLDLTLSEFLKKYCRSLEKNNKNVAALKEKSNYDCIFWDSGCTIYEVRPLQCRTYPFWPFLVESKKDWNEEKYRCRGIGVKSELSVLEKHELYELEKYATYMEYEE